MKLRELSASLEALWRLQGTGAAWDELVRFLAENVDETATLELLARRRENVKSRVSNFSDPLDELWRFLGYELRQATVRSDSRATGHPDDALDSARALSVVAIAQGCVSAWFRADQDRRYGAAKPLANDLLGSCAAASSGSEFFGEEYERTKWRT